jgi:hypothetical protein
MNLTQSHKVVDMLGNDSKDLSGSGLLACVLPRASLNQADNEALSAHYVDYWLNGFEYSLSKKATANH